LKKLVNFEIGEVKFQKLIDHSTALVLVKICTTGDNAHNLPFAKEALVEAAESSLRGKPIVARYNAWEKDFAGHHPSLQIPLGYFVEHQDFEYVDNEDGTTSLYAYAVLWKDYAPQQYDVFVDKVNKGEDAKKSVSMEIYLKETQKGWNGDKAKTQVLKFSFKGVTVLGDKYTPASAGSYAEMVSFSTARKSEVEKYFTGNPDKINKDTDSRSHLLKYYSELGLSTENLVEKEDEKMLESSEAEKFELEEEKAVEETDSVVETNDEEKDMAKPDETPVAEEPSAEDSGIPAKSEEEEEEETEEFKCGKMAIELESLKSENAELKSTNETYMCELKDLREFKFEKMTAEKLLKIEETFSLVSDLLPKEVISEYRNRVAEVEFSQVASFCNEIKSRVVDFADLKPKVQENRFATQLPTKEPKKKLFW